MYTFIEQLITINFLQHNYPIGHINQKNKVYNLSLESRLAVDRLRSVLEACRLNQSGHFSSYRERLLIGSIWLDQRNFLYN